MSDTISLITHIGKNRDYLLIVLHRDNQGWLFRLVSKQGIILQEQIGYADAIAAEAEGKQWLASYLDKA
ncbi:MAG: hypothetical protein EA365_00645 [Gloeocapsa sp. DLM2.Bin57]|nr:MAG: hypothetical protein EA365_00645 [Gloeocapsa sp. DLM2.Bin57]